MDERCTTGKAAAAFVIGGIIGAGIALIFAPHSGTRTRRQIRRIGQRALSKAEAAQAQVREAVEDLVGDLHQKLEDEIENVREWSENRVRDLQRAFDSGKNLIKEEIGKISQG
jgi:gas vesicle protein